MRKLSVTDADFDRHQAITLQIVELLLRHRRRLPGCDKKLGFEEKDVIKVQSPRIEAFVARGARIDFILPAFPAKSPNPQKVLGKLPDMAERLAVDFLHRLCLDIRALYSPGARLVICSDGHVFADLIQVSDDDVASYQTAMKALIADMKVDTIELLNLGDMPQFSARAGDHDGQRELLCKLHADAPERIKQRLLGEKNGVQRYRAITRFMFEDRWPGDTSSSRTALQNKSRRVAIEVIRRSEAWGNLLGKQFPHAIRLSIHPQASTSIKMGIHLIATHDSWLTPWHGVAAKLGDRFFLMKKHEAERLNCDVVMLNRQPSHYQIERSAFVNGELTPEHIDRDALPANCTVSSGGC